MQKHLVIHRKMLCKSKVADKGHLEACFRGSAFDIDPKEAEKESIRGETFGGVRVRGGVVGRTEVAIAVGNSGDYDSFSGHGIGDGDGDGGGGGGGDCGNGGNCNGCISEGGNEHGNNINEKGDSCSSKVNTCSNSRTDVESKDVCPKHDSTPSFQIKKVLKIGDGDKQVAEKTSENCTICGNDFFEKASLMMLSKSKSEGKEYECELCGKTYPLFSSLRNHTETHIGEKLHRCEVCGKDFFKSCGLEAHMKTHTGERPFHCDICSLSFACVFTLEMHTKTQHTEEKPFHCELCGKDFVLRTNLKMHIKMHMGEKLCNCRVCKKNFLINSLLENHLQNQKQLKDKPFYYELRGKDFSIRMHFVFKMGSNKIISGDKLQMSNDMSHDKCKMEIPYKVTLQIQIQNPNGEKAFHSSVCGKDTTIDTQLKEHTPKRGLHFVKSIRKVLRQIPLHHSSSQEKK